MARYSYSDSGVVATPGVGLVMLHGAIPKIRLKRIMIFGMDATPKPVTIIAALTDSQGAGQTFNRIKGVKLDKDSPDSNITVFSDWFLEQPDFFFPPTACLGLSGDGDPAVFFPRRGSEPIFGLEAAASPWLLLMPVSGGPTLVSWEIIVEI